MHENVGSMIWMGWDLDPIDQDVEPFHVTRYAWLHTVSNALRFSGADIRWFGETNDGDHVPEAVAKDWADVLEKGLPDLKCAIIHQSSSPPFPPGTVSIIVPKNFTEEETMDCLNMRIEETCRRFQLEEIISEPMTDGEQETDGPPSDHADIDRVAERCGIDGESLRAIAALGVDLFQRDETITFERFEDISDTDKEFLTELIAFFRCCKGFYQY